MRFLRHGLSVIIFCCFCFFSIVSASPLLDQIVSLEKNNQLADQTIYTFIQDKELLSGLRTLCSEESFDAGNRLGKKLFDLIDEHYAQTSDAQMLIETLDLWNRVQEMHARFSFSDLTDQQICMYKTVMYLLQKHLRKRQIDYLVTHELINDFNETNPILHEVSLKNDVLYTYMRLHPLKRNPPLSVQVTNPEFLDTLSADERLIAVGSRAIMEYALRRVLVDFVAKGWFTADDVAKISPVVELSYTNDCSAVNGKYEVTYKVDKYGQKQQIKTTKLQLTINTCTKIGFILQSRELAKLIIIHEMGHHVWWYKDSSPERFAQICRTDMNTPNGRCVHRDFVSEYAQLSAEEDYAEHFQQRVEKRFEKPGFVATKLNYFEKLLNK